MKDIIIDEEKLLDRAQEVDIKEDKKLILEIVEELKQVMQEHDLPALTAPQIGYPYRVFCMRYSKKGATRFATYINPIITAGKGFALHRQKDISLPGREFIYPRYSEINMLYQTLENGSLGSTFVGNSAIIIQQEVDILDGILLDAIGLEIDKAFDEASEEEKNELLEAYAKAIQEYKEQIDKEIESDPDLKSIDDAAKFMSAVDRKEVKLGAEIQVERPEEK